MGNPFFNNANNANNNSSNLPPFEGSPSMVDQFNQFKSTIQGDPKQMVMNLLQTGQMTQEQYQQLSGMAQMFQRFLR